MISIGHCGSPMTHLGLLYEHEEKLEVNDIHFLLREYSNTK